MTITPLLKPHETHLFKQLYTYVYWAILQILNDTYYSFLWEKITILKTILVKSETSGLQITSNLEESLIFWNNIGFLRS